MKTKTVLGAFILCFIAFISTGQVVHEIKGVVHNVIDGNTIEIIDFTGEYVVYLHGIDCPELGQNYGEQAKKMLTKMILNKHVTIVLRGKDRLGNRLGVIYVEGSPDPRRELIKEGLAWTSERQPVEELEALKEQARLSGKGLWKEDNPTPPWIYRRQQTMAQEKSSD